jgi:hypothetical protein
MRIDGQGRIVGSRGAGPAGRSGAPASRFSLDLAGQPPEAAAPRAAPAMSGLEAMLALQAVDEPLERRRKAIRRGRSLLDALDRLKLALLTGEASSDVVALLTATLREGREQTDDPVLESVLAEIELRAAVEVAKRGGGGL